MVVENAAPIMLLVRDTQDPDPTVDEDGDGITDNEGDGIWDTAVIVIGIRFDMNGTEIDGRVDPKIRIVGIESTITVPSSTYQQFVINVNLNPRWIFVELPTMMLFSSMNISRQDILPRINNCNRPNTCIT